MTTPRSPRESRAMIHPSVSGEALPLPIAASERPCPATEDLPLQPRPGPAAQRRGAEGTPGRRMPDPARAVPAHLHPVGAEHLGEHRLWIGMSARVGRLQIAEPGFGPGQV